MTNALYFLDQLSNQSKIKCNPYLNQILKRIYKSTNQRHWPRPKLPPPQFISPISTTCLIHTKYLIAGQIAKRNEKQVTTPLIVLNVYSQIFPLGQSSNDCLHGCRFIYLVASNKCCVDKTPTDVIHCLIIQSKNC